jgi:hypothetical protein
MNLGEAYIYRDHLHIVISMPNEAGEVVVVNFSTHHANKDQSCVIEAGEHPFVKHKTVVEYRAAWILKPNEQVEFVKDSQKRENVSPELLERIQDGTDSDYIPEKAEKLVIESHRKQKKFKNQ